MPLPKGEYLTYEQQCAHREAVAAVSKRLQHFYALKKPYRVYHGSTNSTKHSNKTVDNVVDTSGLSQVLAIVQPPPSSNDGPSVIVEPNVSMAKLVDATLPFGLVPPVVMEFPAITAGGGFTGTSAEASSFREGVFDRSVTWIEVVLPNGEVVSASPDPSDPRKDLYEGMASSFGTLGILTALRIKLRPAKEYILSRHLPVSSTEDATHVISQHAADPNIDFIDGIMYARDRGIVIVGSLASSHEVPKNTPIQHFSRAWDPWYYLNSEARVFPRSWFSSLTGARPIKGTEAVEAVPIRDFLFRYDRGGFWVARLGFDFLKVPFNWLTRTLVDPVIHTARMYHILHTSGIIDRYVVQDVGVPLAAAPALVDWLDEKWGGYPLWLCPLDVGETAPLFHREYVKAREAGQKQGLMLDVGVWGEAPSGRREALQFNRALEQEAGKLGGQKALYAQAFYTESEFWEIYGKERYDALRKKYCADWMPSVYEKMKTDLSVLDEEEESGYGKGRESWGQWLWGRTMDTMFVRAAYGTAHAVLGSEYLLKKA